MVEVYAEKACFGFDCIVGSDFKFSAEGRVGEVCSFVDLCSFLVGYASEGLCLLFGIVADDVVVCVADCNALVRLGVGYWGFEEGEFRTFVYLYIWGI